MSVSLILAVSGPHNKTAVGQAARASLPSRDRETEGIFTGDFVFVGSIGRPDLLEEAAGIAGTAELGARDLFRSIQRFNQLPDYLQV